MPIDIFTDKKLQIFDLGNVLYSVDARLSFAALQRLGMPAFEGPISNSHAACGDFALYSDGKIQLDPDTYLLHEFKEIPQPTQSRSKKKKRK